MLDLAVPSVVLENAAGLARLDAYIYSPITKWQHWGMTCCQQRFIPNTSTAVSHLYFTLGLRMLDSSSKRVS